MPNLFRKVKKRIGRKYKDIDPEDIFLDSANLPGYAEHRFEGRIEKPIGEATFMILKILLVVICLVFVGKLWGLQVSKGEVYAEVSENNRLDQRLVFANRGVIFDRKGVELATNDIKEEQSDYAGRLYAPIKGLAHVLGYLKYPLKDKAGFYYEERYIGQAGVEKIYDHILSGKNGLKLTETNALGKITSESAIDKPENGGDLKLALDAGVNQELYNEIEKLAHSSGFTGGAGAIMDIRTGELLAITSYPEFDPNLLTNGGNREAINKTFNDSRKPLLNRAVSGLYTPGSIVKPIMALAALNEGIISPEKSIFSAGFISIPNPYNPSNPSIFKDWKANGWTDMREAIAVSSDVYFYAIGGGYQDQKGLGITKIDKYFSLFGMTEPTGIDLPSENSGVIPTPEWKKENFDGDDWRLGDTYITSIGQYGTQVTLLEALRWTAAIANGGDLLVPSVLYGGKSSDSRVFRRVDLPEEYWKVVREGMRMTVKEGGTAGRLNLPGVSVAAKTGTAELGAKKDHANSWTVGFFPYESPKYAFAVLMERAPITNTVGASAVMQHVLTWMTENTPEYLK